MFVGFVTNIRYDLKSPFPHSNCPPNTEFEMSPNTKLEPHHPGTDQMKAAIYSAPGATDHLKLLALQGPLPSLSIHRRIQNTNTKQYHKYKMHSTPTMHFL